MTITTPDDHIISFTKEPHYKHVTFYGGTFDGEEFSGFAVCPDDDGPIQGHLQAVPQRHGGG